jgi:phosphoglycerate kinase
MTGITVSAYALKTSASRSLKDNTIFEIADSMDKTQQDGGTRAINNVLGLSNIVSLREGARTGGYNVEHAIADKAAGGIFNHSEPRAELENKMQNLLMAVRDLANQHATVERYTDVWKKTLETENLSKEDIADLTRGMLIEFLGKPRTKEAIDSNARSLVNKVINANLKKWIAYSSKGAFVQTVLCVGETLEQYKAGKTQEVLLQDLQEILEGITTAQAKSINLRIAYEPRWAIGTGLTPKNDEIQATHRYIKGVARPLIDGIEVDYGGSLKPENAAEILSLPDVNGGLIGGAAKDPAVLEKIINVAIDVYDGKLADGKKKGMILNIGGNWKAEDEATKLAGFDKFASMLKTKDLTKVRLAFGTPRVGAIQSAIAELNQYLTKSSPGAEALVSDLTKNLGDEGARAEALAKIEAVSQGVKDFADLFLIKNKGQVDAEQLAALKSRIRKEKNPEIAPKRVAVFGATPVSRLAVRELTGENYDNLELVAVIGKPNEEIFPFIKRDSQQGVFPGRAEAPNNDFMYLGKQNEAVRVFSDKDFINVVDNLPWKALALDAIILDEETFKKLGTEQLAKLEGIQIVVSRAAGAGFVTYVPGLSNEAEVQKEAKVSAAAGDATAVVTTVNAIKELGGGDVAFVNTDVTEAWNEQVPSTYKLESAYQTGRFKESRFKNILSSQLGINPEKVADTWVIKTQISHGQQIIVTVGINKVVTSADDFKKEVLAKFKKLAGENDVMGLPENWVKLTSNVIWGEKRIFFSPDDLYVKSYPGGTMVTALLFVDEDMANVDVILRAISQKSSAKTPAAKPAKEEYAKSDILVNLQAEKEAKDKASKAKKDKETAARVAEVKNAKKQVLANPAKVSSDAVKALFGEEVAGVKVLRAANNEAVGLFAVQGSTIMATSLLTPKSPADTQAVMAKYYVALREQALALAFLSAESGNDGTVEVVDVYKPEEKLRVKFGVSAKDPKKTVYKVVEQFMKGKWTVIAEPNTTINPAEFAGKFVLAVNGAGGRIGSLTERFVSEKDRNNIRIIAMGGPDSDMLADFLQGRDYVQGVYEADIATGKDWIDINGKRSIVFSSRVSQAFREPENYPWGTFIFAGVPINLAVDATGNFTDEKGLNKHLIAGAGQAWVTAPGDGDVLGAATFVMNRNPEKYDPNKHKIGSTASCTTGCLSMVNLLVELSKLNKDGFLDPVKFAAATFAQKRAMVAEGIAKFKFSGFMVTYHALTEEIIGPDRPTAPKKQTRFRSASENILPTTTGAAKAIKLVDPAADMDGLAVRFPTDVGSLVVGTYILEGTYSKEDILKGLEYLLEIVRGVAIQDVDTTGKIKLDKELRKMMATISPDKIEVKNFINAEGKAMSMVKLDGWYENELYYAREIADFYDFVMRPLKAPAIVTVKDDGRLSTGAEKSATVPLITEMAKAELKGAKVLLRVDFNVSDKNGKIKSDRRIRKSLDTIKYLIDNGATVVLMSHNGKPAGKVVAELSMQKPAEQLQKLLDSEYKVNFIAGSINEQGIPDDVKGKIITGAINVLENTRFNPGDEKNDVALSKSLAALVDNDMVVFDGFGAGERVHASTAGTAAFVERVAIGLLVDKEISSMNDALTRLHMIILGGGPKLAEKVPAVKGGINNLQPKGELLVGSAPSVAFYMATDKIEFGQKASAEGVKDAEGILAAAKAKGGTVRMPVDYVAVDRNLDEKVPGTEKTWLESKKIPEGAKIYNVKLDVANKKLIDTDTGVVMETKDLYVYDIGPETRAAYAKAINNAPKGSAVVWNGAMGVNEIKQFETGTKETAIALAKVSINAVQPEGVFSDVVGDDTGTATDQFGVADQMSQISTGGGASLGLLEGKSLKAMQVLEQIQGNVNTAGKVGLKTTELVALRAAGEMLFTKQGGVIFTGFTRKVRGFLRSVDALKSNRALIIGPEFFRQPGSINAVKEIADLSKFGIKVAIYGNEGKANRLQDLVGNNDIIVGKNLDDVVNQLTEAGIKKEEMLLVRSPADIIDGQASAVGLREEVSSEGKAATAVVAMALKELIGAKEIDALFADFSTAMASSVTTEVTEDVKKAQTQFAEIMDKV